MNGEKLKNVTVQLEEALLTQIDARTDKLDLNRSQYLRRLVRKDLGISTPELSTEAVQPEQVAA